MWSRRSFRISLIVCVPQRGVRIRVDGQNGTVGPFDQALNQQRRQRGLSDAALAGDRE